MESKFFTEDNGNKSLMRIMCFIALLVSVVISLIIVLGKATDTNTGIYLVISYLSVAFGGKLIQKWPENKKE